MNGIHFFRLISFPFYVIFLTLYYVNSDCKIPRVASRIFINSELKPLPDLIPDLTTIEFQCKMGFVSVAGDQFVTCEDTEWKVYDNGEMRDARKFHCIKQTCPIVHPSNGKAIPGRGKLVFKCDEGFYLEGPDEIKCAKNREGNYYLMEDPPKCKRLISCTIPEGSLLNVDENCCSAGMSYTFSCPNGYNLKGISTSIKCGLNGVWEKPLPFCSVSTPCPMPKTPFLIYEKNCCFSQNVYTFSCRSGFRVKGKKDLKCEENGIWSDELPSCIDEDEFCEDPGEIAFAYRSGSCCAEDSLLFYTCYDGYELLHSSSGNTIKCLRNGKWNKPKPYCIPVQTPAICPPPPEENNLEVKIGQYHPDLFLAGDIVDFRCRENHSSSSELEFSFICDEDGDWDEDLPVCRPISPSNNPEVAESHEDVGQTLNVYFIFQTSGSVKRHFKQSKQFIKSLIDKIKITERFSNVKLNFINFNSNVKVLINSNFEEFIEQLQTLKNDATGANFNSAFETVDGLFHSQKKFNQGSSKTLILLMSNGRITRGRDPLSLADKIRLYEDSTFYGIAVGKPRREIIRNIVCGIGKKCPNIFSIENCEKLVNLLNPFLTNDDFIDHLLCGLERPAVSRQQHTSKHEILRRQAEDYARIVGGKDVQRPWPWLAALVYRNQVKCGGSIIANEWILTAAHCFKPWVPLKYWKVVVGSTDLSISGGISLNIEKLIRHEDFDVLTLDFDVALLKLEDPIPFNSFIRPICLPPIYDVLPTSTSMYKATKNATVAGWGKDETFDTVDHLKEVEVPLQAEDVCHIPVRFTDCQGNICRDKIATV